MEKFPFTATGFTQLQEQLYLLPDAQLEAEAAQIQHNFDDWMASHFELSAAQLLFLSAIDNRLHALLAAQTSFAVGNRLPILLLKANPVAEGDEQGKIIWPKSTLTAIWGPNTTYMPSGILEIHIDYRL